MDLKSKILNFFRGKPDLLQTGRRAPLLLVTELRLPDLHVYEQPATSVCQLRGMQASLAPDSNTDAPVASTRAYYVEANTYTTNTTDAVTYR